MLVGDRIRRTSRLNDVHRKALWWHFTLEWVSGKLGLRNQSRVCLSRFLPKTYLAQSIASIWMRTRVGWLLGVSGCNYLCPGLRCVWYDSRPTNTFYDILWHVLLPNVFQAIVCLGTHCRGFKAVSNRASFFGQFVREILGGSVKLDAVILISHKSLFGYALCKALWYILLRIGF